jgi:hypothetical protein
MPRGVKKGISEKKFDKTVKKIKRKGGAKNPYAVANAKLGGKRKNSGKGKKSKSKK